MPEEAGEGAGEVYCSSFGTTSSSSAAAAFTAATG